ncbi:MAG: NAD(P)H-dependent oxidoreductase subunit E [Anaerolineaceae bacterium]|nr:NAD(P)H-dependent oxidoreductase subunit E [Anaerolineaceae bacterium]
MNKTKDILVEDDSVDLAVVDALVHRCGRGADSAIAILQAIQSHFRYLPQEALEHVCRRTEITAAQIAGLSTFYSQFRHKPVGKHIVRVCHGTACHVAGAPMISEALRRRLGIEGDDEDTDGERFFTVEKVPCLGCCSLAPCMTIDDVTYGRLTPHSAIVVIDKIRKESAR